MPIPRYEKNPWTLKTSKIEALKYKVKSEFARGSSGCYQTCKKNGWLSSVSKHMVHGSSLLKLSHEHCKAVARQYQRITDLQINGRGVYAAAKKSGWLEEICAHMTKRGWTHASAKKEALQFKIKSHFKKQSGGCYNFCRKNNLLNTFCSHMEKPFTWTKKTARIEALKYTTKKLFHLKSPGCYMACRNNGWMKYVCSHMPEFSAQDRHEEKIVQPRVQKFLLSRFPRVDKEVNLSRNSRGDFVITTKESRKIVIETKSDKKYESPLKIKSQLTRYKRAAKLKYGNAYLGTFCVSLQGNDICYSLKELDNLFREMNLY
jgi:DNA-binding sugar fermentation-stimulating protein